MAEEVARNYLATAFSPAMMAHIPDNLYLEATVKEVRREDFLASVRAANSFGVLKSIVGHENTAELLSRKLGIPVEFNRETVTLGEYDVVFIAVPQIRFDGAREFTDEEVEKAPFRYFHVSFETR